MRLEVSEYVNTYLPVPILVGQQVESEDDKRDDSSSWWFDEESVHIVS